MKYRSLISGKNEKNNINMPAAEFVHGVVHNGQLIFRRFRCHMKRSFIIYYSYSPNLEAVSSPANHDRNTEFEFDGPLNTVKVS